MSIESDPFLLEWRGRKYQVFVSVDEHGNGNGIDFVRVLFGQAEIYQFKPTDTLNPLQTAALFLAEEEVLDIEWEEGPLVYYEKDEA